MDSVEERLDDDVKPPSENLDEATVETDDDSSSDDVKDAKSFNEPPKVCANKYCDLKSDKYMFASDLCTAYYGLHKDRKRSYYICSKCMKPVYDYEKLCMNALKNGESMFEVPVFTPGPGMTRVESSEDADFGEMEPEVLVKVDMREVDSLLRDTMAGIDFDSQFSECVATVENRLDKINEDFDDVWEKVRRMEKEMDQAKKLCNEAHPPPYKVVHLKSIEIDEHCQKTEIPCEAPDFFSGAKKNQPTLKDKEKGAGEIKEVSWTNNPPPSKRVLFETPSKIPKKIPEIGNTVYAMKRTPLNGWTLGEVDEVIVGNEVEPTVFKIKFTTKKRDMESCMFKTLTAKQLAYDIACPFVLPVGTRIIGLFNDDCAVDAGEEPQDSLFYAGIVAEPPKNTNKYRYLVFFDDGYAQYVEVGDVRLVCESSNPVWADVHADSQEFIRNYVQKYPERPMVRLTEGTVLSTELSGKWLLARVVQVDCSLAKMHFQSENRYEWIYRGSTRLLPLYDSEKRNSTIRDKDSDANASSRRVLPKTNKQNKATIEYLYGNEDAFQDMLAGEETRKVAVKSQSNESLQKLKTYSGVSVQSFVEFEGKISKLSLPCGVPKPKEYIPHDCSPRCIIEFNENNLEYRKLNPLVICFHLGWSREVAKPKRHIYYRTPCGLRITDFGDLHDYLMHTGLSLSIDHFTFDPNVECLNEFQPLRVLYKLQDISYGKEIKPVQAINSVDHDYPDYVEYTSERVCGTGVPLDLNPDFMVCCDCTDDCQDKFKCACWQLTYEGYKKTKDVKDIDDVGYNYRRLKEHIVSGIYECNVKCKCRKTCLNRVAQNKMKWMLQVFKTSNKGWAIRPLYDIPEGSFICVYAGQILTEQGANEDGKFFGDEYLAELDFIEVCEKTKEGYEESVVDPESYIIDLEADETPKVAVKRTHQRALDDDDSNEGYKKQPSRFTAKLNDQQIRKKTKNEPEIDTRDFYKDNEQCFILDAKSIGNIGRYLNHCCSPNVYVQNVFVDTHDARFPWVAFFAHRTIRAGTEMTWDYNYEIGSVPEKTLYCQCGSPDCRGRLL